MTDYSPDYEALDPDELMDPIGFTHREVYAIGAILEQAKHQLGGAVHDAITERLFGSDSESCICDLLNDVDEKLATAHEMARRRQENGGTVLPQEVKPEDFVSNS